MRLFNKLKERRNKKRFDAVAAQVLNTKPIKADKSAKVVILSQVYHSALDMSLLALKSFAVHFGPCDIEILDDGSLTNEDHNVIEQQLPGCTVTHISVVDTQQCPTGNCWERLVRIIELSQERYVIQVDTDTLTIAAIPEIVDAVKNDRAFTIGNPIFNTAVSTEYMSAIANNWKSNHVQVEIERRLNEVELENFSEYCRGCAALAGFPPKTVSMESLNRFSEQMNTLLGSAKWNEWGSEQVASNVMISICKDKQILPWPKYANYGFPSQGDDSAPETFAGKCASLHFIGSHRFSTRCYEKLADQVIKNILGTAGD